MAFIIEGADELGKTTLAHRIVELANERERWPVKYGHMSRPPSSFNFRSHYGHWTTPLTVQDRFHLGGLVWHEGVINEEALRDVEAWLRMTGSFVLVLSTPDDSWYRNKLEGTDQMFCTSVILEANDKFRRNRIGGLDVSIDARFTVYEDHYPTDSDIEAWIDEWFSRLSNSRAMFC